MATRTPPVEPERPPGQWNLVAIISILGVAAASAFGGACAWFAGLIVSTRIWGVGQPPIAAKWCPVCYLGSSLLFSATSLHHDRNEGGSGDWTSSAILQNYIFGALHSRSHSPGGTPDNSSVP